MKIFLDELELGLSGSPTARARPHTGMRLAIGSDGSEKRSVRINETVGHAGSVEGKPGTAVFVEEDKAAGALRSIGQQLDGSLRGARGCGVCRSQEIARGLGHDHFHDGFAVPGSGHGAGFPIGIATTTDERGIADPAGKLAAGATSRSCSEQAPLLVERDGADRTLFVAAVMLGGMGILAATFPGFALGGRNERFRIAEGDVVV